MLFYMYYIYIYIYIYIYTHKVQRNEQNESASDIMQIEKLLEKFAV